MLYASMPAWVAALAAAMERTPLRHRSTAFLPGGTAARTFSPNPASTAMPGHCFHASGTAPGTNPTHSRSASVRTSTSTASPSCHQRQASSGETSPAYPSAGRGWSRSGEGAASLMARFCQSRGARAAEEPKAGAGRKSREPLCVRMSALSGASNHPYLQVRQLVDVDLHHVTAHHRPHVLGRARVDDVAGEQFVGERQVRDL